MSPTCFGAHCVILREKSYHFSKPSVHCKVVTTVELQSMEFMWGFHRLVYNYENNINSLLFNCVCALIGKLYI